MDRRRVGAGVIFLCLFDFSGMPSHQSHDPKEPQLKAFVSKHTAQIQPLHREAALAYWQAAVTGESEHYDRFSALELKIRRIYSDPDEFALLKAARDAGSLADDLLTRQVDVLYHQYLGNQVSPELLKQTVELSTEIERTFSTHRPTLGPEKVTDNRIKEILKTETDPEKRKQAWLASKQVGPQVAGDLIRLVKLRNQAAHALGFENYHTMSLVTAEQRVEDLVQLFGELDDLTREPFQRVKGQLDALLAARLGVTVEDLRPWHYHDPFFQETPMVYDLDLDVYYKGKDIKTLSSQFYAGLGLDVASILDDSDLYERGGKNPHAFCTDIDRAGDVRILCNIKDNETWMETQLHELGHAVYDKFMDQETPYLLREPAHIFTTEGIAMFFGRLSRNARWMQQMLDLSEEQRVAIEEIAGNYAQLKQLIFARWAMVMFHFERALYADPDQDLNALWWDTVETYQRVTRPQGRDEPDWAAKIHFAIAPCYYHNYLLGELFASQLHHKLVTDVIEADDPTQVSYVGQERVGRFLVEQVFEPAAIYPWNQMIERATGESLTAKYFVAQFVRK